MCRLLGVAVGYVVASTATTSPAAVFLVRGAARSMIIVLSGVSWAAILRVSGRQQGQYVCQRNLFAVVVHKFVRFILLGGRRRTGSDDPVTESRTAGSSACSRSF